MKAGPFRVPLFMEIDVELEPSDEPVVDGNLILTIRPRMDSFRIVTEDGTVLITRTPDTLAVT